MLRLVFFSARGGERTVLRTQAARDQRERGGAWKASGTPSPRRRGLPGRTTSHTSISPQPGGAGGFQLHDGMEWGRPHVGERERQRDASAVREQADANRCRVGAFKVTIKEPRKSQKGQSKLWPPRRLACTCSTITLHPQLVDALRDGNHCENVDGRGSAWRRY